MKQTIKLTSIIYFAVIYMSASAQIKVFSGGKVNVGATTTPTEVLEVTSGNINLATSSNAYMIAGNKILMNYGNTSDIFVGYNAGNSSTTVHYNTFIGYYAGNATTSGAYNVANGYGSLKANTSGGSNTANGYKSLYNNSTGGDNTANGFMALLANTSGSNNTSNGYQTLYTNQTGHDNTASGSNALFTNTANYNTGIGSYALYTNGTGVNNTATGYKALYLNTTGEANVANGFNALYKNTTGIDNVAIGVNALHENLTAANNTAIGYQALYWATVANNTAIGSIAGYTITTGDKNTFIGCNADASVATNSNSTAIGYNATVGASNKVRIGDANVTVIEGSVAWSFPSDARFKTNIQEDVKGLEFIKKLRPVNYQFNTATYDQFLIQNMPDSIKTIHTQGVDFTASSAIVHTGFIAQEVEQAALSCGYIFDGLHKPDNENDNYSLAYSQFVVPLVKAVQELSKNLDTLQTKTTKLDSTNAARDAALQAMQDQITALNEIVNTCCSILPSKTMQQNNSNPETITNSNSKDVAVLYQNKPNPFNNQTVIGYYVPTSSIHASIIIFDMQGKLLKTIPLEQKEKGNIKIDAGSLIPGMYMYSLVIDAKEIDTKRMILTK